MSGQDLMAALCRLALGHRSEEDITAIQGFLAELEKAKAEEAAFNAAN